MANFDWHGYAPAPQVAEVLHPERPWWCATTYGCGRTDGARIPFRNAFGEVQYDDTKSLGPLLAAYDVEHPLPSPPPLCGQVWVDERGTVVQVVAVRCGLAWMQSPILPDRLSVCSDWPPPFGTALVAGPGAPWSPLAMGREY